MYQLSPALLDSQITLESKNNKKNKTYKNKRQVQFDLNSNQEKQKLDTINNLIHSTNEDDDDDDNNYKNFNKDMLKSSKLNDNNMTNNDLINHDLINDDSINKNLINNELKKMDSFNELHKSKYSKDVASIDSGEIYSNYNDSYKKNLKILNNNNQVQSINDSALFDNNTDNTINKNNNLLSKLDYIIHLLEQQHNEKTNYITEDLILYLFLGIFIIYVLDIFSKSGKYNR